MWVVTWTSGTGRKCEWTTADEREAVELANCLAFAGVVTAIDELPDPAKPWTVEEILAHAG